MTKVTIGKITDSCLGKMLDKEKNKGIPKPYLANINVRWGDFDTDSLSYMRFEENENERYGIKDGDLIVCEGGEPGRCAIWDGRIADMKIQKALHRVRAKSGYDIRYIYYWMLLAGKNNALEKYFTGSTIKHLPGDRLKEIELEIPNYKEQVAVADLLSCLDLKIQTNAILNDNLAQMLRLLYEQWFYRFEFPNEQNLPYNRANGELEWNDKLKRRIPKGWKVQTMLSNELFSVISSGIDRFSTKKYYATADIIGTSIGEGSDIEYETRESRANMQPVINSIWFAKMKNSIKHLFLNKEMSSFVDNSILSTGFYGLKCNEISFEYIASVVSAPIFEITKDRLSHGATQQGIGDDDMANITLLIPDDTTLRKYHETTKGFFAKISNNILENKRLIAIRNFLLPLLMNGQATIAE